MIAVILPSRGLIFSRTAEEILNNLKGIDHKIFFSHRAPIPNCFEIPTHKALSDESVTHLWFVEEDMVLCPNILEEMVALDKAVVTVDYPVTKDGRGAVFSDAGGKVLFCGTGCLLIKREVFDELKAPYFRDDIRWTIKNLGDQIKITGMKADDGDGYGLHDVNFCMSLDERSIPIHVLETTVGQRKLVALGKAGTNNGAHNIEVWDKVKKGYMLEKIQSYPVQNTGALVSIVTPSGEVMVTKTHANTLVEKGLAKHPPKRHSIIDRGNL